MADKQKKAWRSNPSLPMLLAVMLFFFLGFFMLALKDGRWESFLLAVVVPAIIFVGTAGISRLFPSDRLLLSLTNFLCALGVLMLYRMEPQEGLNHALKYGIGVACMIFCTFLVRYISNWKILTWLMMLGSLGFLALPLLFGTETGGAILSVRIGGSFLQPSEFVKLALILSVSYLLSQRKVILSILFSGACLLLLMWQKDLGTALLYFGVTFLLLYSATGSVPLLIGGIAGGAGAAVVGYMKFAHVKKRVAIWLNPWEDIQGDGYQIVQSLIAIVNGGLWGVGLGLGNAFDTIPASKNDCIFPVIVHEFGMIFGLMVLCMYAFIVIRGIMIARRSRTVFHTLLAAGCAALIALQTFVIVGGNIKLIPLTGVTLPFISSGGSSMVSSLCVIGLLQGVASRNAAGVREDRRLTMQGGDAL